MQKDPQKIFKFGYCALINPLTIRQRQNEHQKANQEIELTTRKRKPRKWLAVYQQEQQWRFIEAVILVAHQLHFLSSLVQEQEPSD